MKYRKICHLPQQVQLKFPVLSHMGNWKFISSDKLAQRSWLVLLILFYSYRFVNVNIHFSVTAESDICTFSARTEHFHVDNKPSSSLFTSNTRPKALRELYEAAAIVAVRGLDSLRRDGSSMDMFLCTPVLGKRRRDQSLDIESRIVCINLFECGTTRQ